MIQIKFFFLNKYVFEFVVELIKKKKKNAHENARRTIKQWLYALKTSWTFLKPDASRYLRLFLKWI